MHRARAVISASVVAALAGGSVSAETVLSADDIQVLPASPDRRFPGETLPWLDPDRPLSSPSLAPLLYYQLEEGPSLLARRVGDSVEIVATSG